MHNLEAAELLDREDHIVGGQVRKYYRITPLGQRTLDEARSKVIDLVDEVTEPQPRAARKTTTKRRKRT